MATKTASAHFDVDLSTRVCGLKLSNPTVLASGIWGTSGNLLVRAAKAGAGAVTSKSCSLKAREGHPNPTILLADEYALNAVGLSNPGARLEVEELKLAKAKAGVPIIASIFGNTMEDFASVAKIVLEAKPDAIEANISCPNVHKEGEMFACSAASASKVTGMVKEAAGKAPVLVKLSPNVTSIVQIAKSVEDAGADGIIAINTVSGMLVDAHARRPILSNKFGGISGKAIKPVALKAVYEISRAVQIPVIGVGGVFSGLDAAEMLMCGASAVGVGTALSYRENAFASINSELAQFMSQNGYSKIRELK
ncbi:dihydroorotate dehydrogenase, partial [Candidatus Parvarchaeota archaeon]|nr:dihydroorotate dehydrogenase [Candidatus Parvarchaeota archaeon]